LQITKKLANDILKGSASKSSLYVSEIIALMPNTMLLSSLNYQPLMQRIKNKKPIILQENTIVLSGKSYQNELFTAWINSLNNLTWVHNVAILKYSDQNSKASEFSIKLNLKDE
jgi:hypothetical protein